LRPDKRGLVVVYACCKIFLSAEQKIFKILPVKNEGKRIPLPFLMWKRARNCQAFGMLRELPPDCLLPGAMYFFVFNFI
jgi:hypothetical protein